MSKDQYQHISDNDLLQRFRHTKNNEWLGVLLQRYTLLLLGVCIKYLKDENEAQDCVQQIFLKVIQEVEKYEISYFKSWLYMVAKNQCLTLLRNKKGKALVAFDDAGTFLLDETDDAAPNHSWAGVNDEILLDALEALNKEQYTCVTLFYLKKNSYQEISNITGYSILKVKSHIQNGKRNLKLSILKKIKKTDSTHAR